MSSQQALQDKFGRNIVFAMKVRLQDDPDPRGPLMTVVSEAGALVSEFELECINPEINFASYQMMVFTTGDEQMQQALDNIEKLEGVIVDEVIDLAMESHRGGACEMVSSSGIESNTDLRIVYTPGVARVCKAIQAEPELAREYTGIHNTVAVVSNGTAILGLGDIGCVAGMPVMEGKSAIFAEFTKISAIPILVDTKDPDEFVEAIVKIAPSFGAIQVEDVAAPECFKITRELDRRLDIPVMHDDQHGTATIVLAGLYSALKMTNKKIENLTCAISGAGAAATAITELLQMAGIKDVILTDSKGVVCKDRTDLNDEKRALAERTNKQNISGSLADAMKGADLFIGCSRPNLVSQEMVKSMNHEPIVFALANPVSEISREDAIAAGAAIYADGREMNNAIAYPGIFRGALDSCSDRIDFAMMNAAANKLAEIVPQGQLLPEMMDPATHEAVAEAVMQAVENN